MRESKSKLGVQAFPYACTQHVLPHHRLSLLSSHVARLFGQQVDPANMTEEQKLQSAIAQASEQMGPQGMAE